MKKVLALVLAAVLMLCASAMAEVSVSTTAAELELTGDPTALKVGVILVGDENEGYTYAHIEGIQQAAEVLGVPAENIIWKYSVAEDATCYDAAADLADAGCNVVMPNLSPRDYRSKYLLYDNKIATGDEAAESLNSLKERMARAGYEIVTDRGDYKEA